MARKRSKESSIDNELLDSLVQGIKTEEDINAVLRELSKGLFERVLEAEMTDHLGHESGGEVINAEGNTRNGTNTKTLKGDLGEIELDVPRDRQGEFEPQLVKKYQTRLAGLDKRILSLYARGLSTTDIQDELREIYEVELSPSSISTITDAVIDEVNTWQARPLEALYPVVYLDCIYVKLRVEGSVRTQAVYVAIAINLDGVKEVLGLWVGKEAHEGARFWLSVLTELQQRGLEDVFIFCVDGLKGFPEAIEQVYPQSQIQLCIVHLIRNSLQFVWRRHWLNIIPIFDYPVDIRKVIYTTNIIESLNYSLKKPLKTRGAFPSETALMKVLYLAICNASEKWTMPIRNWKKALNWFAQMFGDRLLDRLNTRN